MVTGSSYTVSLAPVAAIGSFLMVVGLAPFAGDTDICHHNEVTPVCCAAPFFSAAGSVVTRLAAVSRRRSEEQLHGDGVAGQLARLQVGD